MKLVKHRTLAIFQILAGAYVCLVSFTPIGTLGSWGGLVDPITGFIIDPSSEENTERGVILIKGDLRPIVAETPMQMIELAISRLSAYTMYPGRIFDVVVVA